LFHVHGGRGGMALYVRAAANPTLIIPKIREEVRSVDKAAPQFEVRTLAEEMDAALLQQRLIATLSSLFGILALLLACVGLYGLFAFAVMQRTSEIGLRVALGAPRGSVLWIILREALLLALLGVAVGIPAALAAGRLASGLLFQLKPADPPTMAAAAILLLSAAAVAAYLPARRASRVDPMVALRNE
jgi:ABC-type antimicrobial peptide transport system permease subunit